MAVFASNFRAMKRSIQFSLNGHPASVVADDQRALLWVLRTELQLTGTKYGCGEGICGACTVLIGDRIVRSCVAPLHTVEGMDVVTVEGLAKNGDLHPLQQAFVDYGAFQCGYCTPGMLLAAYAFLRTTPDPTREAIVTHMDRNLCRCGSHQRIVEAIESAARRMRARP
jgi:aerobic-type carbon monoxide dehydrogenase small subunit (CoxS/CutS family)